MKLISPLVAALAFVVPAFPALAQESENPLLAPETARPAILACLAEVDAEGEAMAAESTDEEWASLRRPSDCIGVASDPCQADNGYTTYAIVTCVSGEIEAWEALMTEWLAAALDGASDERRAVIEDSQALWRQAMERSLEIYAVARYENGGGSIWPTLAAADALDTIGRRSLWLRSLSSG